MILDPHFGFTIPLSNSQQWMHYAEHIGVVIHPLEPWNHSIDNLAVSADLRSQRETIAILKQLQKVLIYLSGR